LLLILSIAFTQVSQEVAAVPCLISHAPLAYLMALLTIVTRQLRKNSVGFLLLNLALAKRFCFLVLTAFQI
jgi:hypothetical protein